VGQNPTQHLAGGISIVGAAAFVIIVAVLHLLQPAYDGRYQLMSELALGPHGWAMLPAFGCLAVSVAGVQQGLLSLRAHWPIQFLLVTAAVCLLGAGVFRLGDATELHVALVAVAFVLLVLAMYLAPSQVRDLSSPRVKAVSWALAVATAFGVLGGHSVLPLGIGQLRAVS
jgi:hypothetical membrane protein